ncbi:MAG: mycothiol transferase [Acidimicrobiales bacterium]
MDVSDLLLELYGRIEPLAQQAVEGLTPEQLRQSPAPGCNSIGWLVWHLARVQDHQLCELSDAKQVWVGGDWASRFGLEPDPSNLGYGHSPEQVAAVQPDGPQSLLDYLAAVEAKTQEVLEGISPADLDRIVDERWDPPVTLGVRLVSIAYDCLQHVGQACYLRGFFGW